MGTDAAHPAGKPAPGLKCITAVPGNPGGRDVFLYIISGETQLNPAAALALIAGLQPSA